MLKKFSEEIECVLEPVSGRGGLFISNIEAAENPMTLKKYQISAVLTVARGHKLVHPEYILPRYLYLPADDHEHFNIAEFFEKSNQFISQNLQVTNVLVHCVAGISRSASLILAYLMTHHGIKLSGALSFLRNRRNKVQPNRGFLKQLRSFETYLDGTNNFRARNESLREETHPNRSLVANDWRRQKPGQMKKSFHQDQPVSLGVRQAKLNVRQEQAGRLSNASVTFERPGSNHQANLTLVDDDKFNSMRRELDQLKENIKNLKCKFDEMKKSNVNTTLTEFSRKNLVQPHRTRPTLFRF